MCTWNQFLPRDKASYGQDFSHICWKKMIFSHELLGMMSKKDSLYFSRSYENKSLFFQQMWEKSGADDALPRGRNWFQVHILKRV